MSRKSVIVVVVLAIAVISVIWLQPLRCSESQAPTVDFLAAALRNQDQGISQSLQVHYTFDWCKYVDGILAGHATRDRRYVRAPEAIRIEEIEADGDKSVASYDRSLGEGRTLSVESTGRSSGRIWTARAGILLQRDLLETSQFPLYEGALCERIAYGRVGDQMEPIDGYDCWRVDIPTDYAGLDKYVVWLDPDIGFNPRKLSFVWAEGQNPEEVVFLDYASVGNDVWFPRKQVVTYSRSSNEAETFAVTNVVTSIETGTAFEKSELVVAFPSGTSVHGTDLQFVAP